VDLTDMPPEAALDDAVDYCRSLWVPYKNVIIEALKKVRKRVTSSKTSC